MLLFRHPGVVDSNPEIVVNIVKIKIKHAHKQSLALDTSQHSNAEHSRLHKTPMGVLHNVLYKIKLVILTK